MRAKEQVLKFLKSDLGFVITVFLIWRIFMFAFGYWSSITFETIYRDGAIEQNFWNIWGMWDGGHYLNLAANGYYAEFITAFFPLYSFLIRILSYLPGVNTVLAGIFVSSAATVVAGFWLIKLVKLDYSEKAAKLSFIYLLLFPSAVALASIYTEPLFLMTTIGAFYFARKKNWLLVLILGFAAGLTRNLGCFLVLPLLYEYFKRYKFKIRWPIIAVGAPGFALFSYMAFLWYKFGDPFLFIKIQAEWGRRIIFNIFERFYLAIVEFLRFDEFMRGFELGSVIFMIIMIILMIKKKIRPSYILWSSILIIIPVMQSHWLSMNRFVLVIFPVFITLGLIMQKHKYLNAILLGLFAGLLAIQTSIFVNLIYSI